MKLLVIDEQTNVNQVCINAKALKALTGSKEVHPGRMNNFKKWRGECWGMDVIEGDPLEIGGFLPSALYDSN